MIVFTALSESKSSNDYSQIPYRVDIFTMSISVLQHLQPDTALDDGQARFDAIQPQHSFIVQAPAGSGKTALLTQRFLALLSQVEAPEQIVAMTFTKKAAAEMQERIYHALQASQHPLKADAGIYEKNTWLLAQAALQNSEKQQWQLLENPQRLRIRTLDSMNSALVQQMPLLSRFGASVSVITDAEVLYRQAARDALNDPDAAKASITLIEKVNGNLGRAENLLVSMLKKRDQWMPLLAELGNLQDKSLFDHALNRLVVSEFAAWHAVLKPQLSLLKEACSILLSVEEGNRPEGSEWSLLSSFDIEQNLPGRGALDNQLNAWKQLANALLTASGTFRARLTKKEGFPNASAEQKDIKEQMSEVLSSLAEQDASGQCAQSLAAIRGLPSAEYTEDQWQGIVDLMTLLKTAAAYLKIGFSHAGQTDFIEVAQAASEALGEEEQPTDLAQRLDYQIKHLLIDEFQDTSVSQFKFLKKLIAGWQVDDQHSLFIVGDPMQSIYRFREAEVGNFLEVWSGRLGQVSLACRHLTVNFRSDQAVVDWVNDVFPSVLPAQNQIERGAVCYSPSLAKKESDAFSQVVTHWAINRNDEQELVEVVDLIKKRVGELEPAESIGILGRSRGHLMPIARTLKQQGIGFRAVELETLSERQEIQDAQALTRALLHLSDRPAWLALLRSPIVGLSLSDLYALLGDAKSFKQPVLQRLNDAALVATLSDEGQKRLAHALPILLRAVSQVGYLAWSRLIRETWLALGMAQSVESETALQNVNAYWQMLQDLEADSTEPLTFERLQSAVDNLFAAPDASEGAQTVELMTMHKSKGLEFDTVILPGLGKATRGDEKPLMTWLNFKDEQQDYLVMAPLDQKGQSTSDLVGFIQRFEAEKQGYELGRLLYVAATRAKTQLHLFASVAVGETKLIKIEEGKAELLPAEKSLLSGLWQSQKQAFDKLLKDYVFEQEALEEEVVAPKVSRMPLQGLVSLENWWQKQLAKESMTLVTGDLITKPPAKYSATDKAQMAISESDAMMITAIGNLVHAVLEQWAQTGALLQQDSVKKFEGQAGYYRYWLAQQGLTGEQLNTAVERVNTSLKNVLQSSKLNWALNPKHTESATELALSSFGLAFEEVDDIEARDNVETFGATQHHIVDRTFVDEQGVRWIIDYKTSYWHDQMSVSRKDFVQSKVDEYRSQLERYGKLFSQIEQRPQKHVLYFTYLDEWVEVAETA